MRAATYVQAFQFVLKLLMFLVPAIWLLLAVGADTRTAALRPAEYTTFPRPTEVTFRLDTRLEVREPVTVLVGGVPRRLAPGTVVAPGEATWVFPEGAAVPEIAGSALPGSDTWQHPLLDGGNGHPLLATWSILVATALGTMGLPHVIVRFHTSPDGRAARRTAAITVGLLGSFYVFTVVYGLLGGVMLPELYLSGATDTAVVALPSRVDGGTAGSVFTALLTAGAFAAFLATSLGLLLALAGALAHDLLPGSLRRLRLTALLAAGVIVLCALPAVRIDVGSVVTSAFAVAASTFCPLLVLGIWWRGLTARGAFAGMIVGLVSSAGVMGTGFMLRADPGPAALVLAQPALFSVPLAFLTMIAVSLRGRPAPGSDAAMLRLHLDET
jgi:Na+(H+)/acetate symporter ActP